MQQTMPLLSRACQQTITGRCGLSLCAPLRLCAFAREPFLNRCIFSQLVYLLDGAGVEEEEVVLVLEELLESEDLLLDDSVLDSALDSVLDSDPFFGEAAPPLERA
jgi:hypothetical protein